MESAARRPIREERTARLRPFVGVLAFVLLPASGWALDPALTLTQYGHTAWRVRDGAFVGTPGAIAQTRDGFLWLATDAGLVRFDGARFTPWTPPSGVRLPDDLVVSVLGASDGSLWIGTAGGVARWQAGKLEVLTRIGRFGALAEDRTGAVWVGHTRSLKAFPPLCRYRGGELRCFRFPPETGIPYVSVLHVDRKGELWIGSGGRVCRWRAERPGLPECFPIPPSPSGAEVKAIFGLSDDVDGTLWASDGATGIWRLEAGRWQPVSLVPGSVLPSQAILGTPEAGMWVGTDVRGVVRRFAGRTEVFSQGDGLTDNAVNGLFRDREGNLWVATASGLDRFRDLKVATFSTAEGLEGGAVCAVGAAREGGLWIAQERALYRGRLEGSTLVPESMPLPGKNPTCLLEDARGSLWLGVDDALFRWDGRHFVRIELPSSVSYGVVREIAEDRSGDVWISTTDPAALLVRLHDDRVVEAVGADRLADGPIVAMTPDPAGGVWIGLGSGTVGLYREGRFAQAAKAGWPVVGLLSDSRGLWVVTRRGLGLLRGGRLRLLDTAGGLPCGDGESVIGGGDGSLWLKATCGLIHLSRTELERWIADPRHRVLAPLLDPLDGARAGLASFTPRAARTRDGRLWFAIDSGGLQVFDPRSPRQNRLPPPVQILGLVADRKAYAASPSLRLPPRTRDLEIDYTALDLAVPEKVRFRYRLMGGRLIGGSGEWEDAGSRRAAFFSNLRPGRYRFQVAACNNDGVWNETGAALGFTLLPAFYQTGWFLALGVFASCAVVWQVYRWRVRQVAARLDLQFQERLSERTRIAQDLHDTLLQGFLGASMQLHVLADELPPEAPEKPRLHRILHLMSQVVDEGRGSLRGLRAPRPPDLQADDLGEALTRVRGELGIEERPELRVLIEGRPAALNPIVRDEVYRIGREALVNAFRHAGAGAIEVEIEYAPRALRLRIRDDGAGIDPQVLKAGREGHFGLSGMRERAEALGGRLKVWSRTGTGTEVELSVSGRIAFQTGPKRGPLDWLAHLFSGSGG